MSENSGMTDAAELTPIHKTESGYTECGYRMSAYYYGFNMTGLNIIDTILSAVACAGKAYHHTDQWTDGDTPGKDYNQRLSGDCPAEWIQNAAMDAEGSIRELIADRDRLTAEVLRLQDAVMESDARGAALMAERDAMAKANARNQDLVDELCKRSNSAVAERDALQRLAVDVFDAYKAWPADIREKLSFHDLRRMDGWKKGSETE